MAAAADTVEADTHECNSNHSSCTECNDTRTEYNGSYRDEQPPVGRRCKRCNRWYLERYMCLPHPTCVRSSCQSVHLTHPANIQPSTLTTTVLMGSPEVDSRRATRSEATEQHRGRNGPRATNPRAVAFRTPIALSCAALMLQEGGRCYLAVLLLLSSNSSLSRQSTLRVTCPERPSTLVPSKRSCRRSPALGESSCTHATLKRTQCTHLSPHRHDARNACSSQHPIVVEFIANVFSANPKRHNYKTLKL